LSEAADLRDLLSAKCLDVFIVYLRRKQPGLESAVTAARAVVNGIGAGVWNCFVVDDLEELETEDPELGKLISADDATVDAVVLGLCGKDGLDRGNKNYAIDDVDDEIEIANALAKGAQL